MIHIEYEQDVRQARVHFKGGNFTLILDFVKKLRLQYDPETKAWVGSPAKALTVAEKFNDIDDVMLPAHVETELKQSVKANKETKFFEANVDTSLLKHPPIQGKSPHESYQVDAIKKGISTNRYFYALEMGLGKSYIIINVINHLWSWGKIDRLLILCPSEGVYNLRRELLRFSDFFSKDDIYIANRFNRDPIAADRKVCIMTYNTFRMISDDFYKVKTGKKGTGIKYRTPTIPFDQWGSTRCLICDESHSIENWIGTKQTKVVHLHKQYFEYRYLMTGTPATKGPQDYYSQMRLLDESSVADDYYEFLAGIANLGRQVSRTRFAKNAVNYFYPDKVEAFMESISPWVMRLKSKEVLELPELIIDRIYTEMSSQQTELYRALVDYVLFMVKRDSKDDSVEVRLVVQKFPFLVQALDNPCLLKGKIDKVQSPGLYNMVDAWRFEDHGKLEILDSLLHKYIDEQGRKVVLFDYHPLTIEQLTKRYQKKYNPLFIHGRMERGERSMDEIRSDIVGEFKQSKNRNLLIGSSIMLSTSINLQEATRAIYFSRTFSYMHWSQSQKRLHRIGQTEPVVVNPLLFEDSLDLRLDKNLKNKEDMDKFLLNRNALSKNQWKQLFLGEDLTD